MNAQSNPLSPCIEFFRTLSSNTLAGSEEMVFWQIDHAQELIGRSSKQMLETLSNAGAAQKPENWPMVMGNGIRGVFEIGRECAITASDLQRETCNLLQRQAMETQKALTESLNEQFAIFQMGISHQKRPVKDTVIAHRTAA